MVIKRGKYALFVVIVMFDFVLFIVSLLGFLLGFDINYKSVLFFCLISVILVFLSVILYVFISHFIKHKYVFDDKCITYLKKDKVLNIWYYENITKAEYIKFSEQTIIYQRIFGDIKITMNDGSQIVFSAFLKQIKKINQNYFKVKIKK